MSATADLHDRSRTTTLRVPAMDCPSEERPIREALRAIPAVHALRVRLAERSIEVRHGGDPAPLVEAVRRAGFEAEVAASEAPGETGRRILLGVGAATAALGAGTAAAALGAPRWAVLLLHVVAVGAAGRPMIRKGLAALVARRLDMNALMTIAVAGALAIGEWTEGAVVAILFAVAEYLEAASLDRARGAIRGLLDLAPPTARVKTPRGEAVVPADEVGPGQVVVVLPGEKVPIDGEIVSGESSLDQAAITGESVPVPKGPGDGVFAGSVNGEGALEIRATRRADDTTLARTIEMVERAEAERAPAQRFVDAFAARYTPIVIAGAAAMAVVPPILGAALEPSIYRALALLVIACPCALVISTPVSVVSALAAAARRGVLIKGGAYLEALGRPDVFVLDKTGTLTRGRPALHDIVPLAADVTEEDLLRLAAALEARSEHPLGRAVVEAAEKRGIAVGPAAAVEALRGRGLAGRVEGRRVLVVSHRSTDEAGVCDGEAHRRAGALERAGKTVALVRREGDEGPLGILAFADEIRPGAAEAILRLRREGATEIRMLTGDNRIAAETVAASLGLDGLRAECLPEAKVEEVRGLVAAGRRVVFVGDGVNDAPALAAATVGVAMGAAGSDAALETADAALMGGDLSLLPWTVSLGRRTRRVIGANIALSIGIKAVFVGLVLAGHATLWGAIAADMGASLLVIGNGLRLLRTGA